MVASLKRGRGVRREALGKLVECERGAGLRPAPSDTPAFLRRTRLGADGAPVKPTGVEPEVERARRLAGFRMEGDGRTYDERIRLILEVSGMSRRALARAIGLNQSNFNRYANGKNAPPASVLAKIVEYTGCSPAWILLGHGSMFGEPVA